MLAIEVRQNQEDRTLGDLFYLLKEEMADIKLSYSLMILIDTLRYVLHSHDQRGSCQYDPECFFRCPASFYSRIDCYHVRETIDLSRCNPLFGVE